MKAVGARQRRMLVNRQFHEPLLLETTTCDLILSRGPTAIAIRSWSQVTPTGFLAQLRCGWFEDSGKTSLSKGFLLPSLKSQLLISLGTMLFLSERRSNHFKTISRSSNFWAAIRWRLNTSTNLFSHQRVLNNWPLSKSSLSHFRCSFRDQKIALLSTQLFLEKLSQGYQSFLRAIRSASDIFFRFSASHAILMNSY